MSWHHIVMNHSSTADGGCVQQPAHRRDPQQWGHSVVASLHHRQWQHVSVLDSLHSAPHQPIQLWQFAFLTEVLSGFAVSTKQRLAKVTKQCLIMFYKSYKYEFQECKWMRYIYIYINWFKKNKMWNTSIKLPWSLAVKWIKLQLIQTYQINEHLEAPYTCILFNGQHQVLFKYWIAENYPWLDGSVTPVNTFLLTNLLNYGHF